MMGGISVVLVPARNKLTCSVCDEVLSTIGPKQAAAYPDGGLAARRIGRLIGGRSDYHITLGQPWRILSRDEPRDPDEVLRLVLERIGVLGETELGYEFIVLIAEAEMVEILKGTLRDLSPITLGGEGEPTPRAKLQAAWMV